MIDYSLAEWLKDYKRLLEQEPCDDAISRQAAIDGLNSINGTSELDKAFEVIENLPPVTPQPKTGHWIYTDYYTWCCSECGGNPHKGTGFIPNKDGMKIQWKYCNLCGAKMEG